MVDLQRMSELGQDGTGLARWADIAYGLQSMAIDYDPSGSVGGMDVFDAAPLRAVAQTRGEWLEKHLQRWTEFCRTEPRFHSVEGAHYTMLGPEHVVSFAKTLRLALEARYV